MSKLELNDLNPDDAENLTEDEIRKIRGGASYTTTGDNVTIQFQQGDVRQPYIIGSLWNSNDRPPESS